MLAYKVLIKRLSQIKQNICLSKLNLKKLEKFDAAYFRDKNYFDDDGTQNCLVFQPVYKYFQRVRDEISSWKSKGLFSENN